MKRNEVLETAAGLINGDRKEDYGDAFDNHQRIADFWNCYLDHQTTITPSDVANMMILMKIARLMHTSKDDSYVDICGYAALGSEMSKGGE